MGFELELENVVFVYAIGLLGDAHAVAQQWEAGQWVVILMSFVEEQTEIGKDDPELLPAMTVFELS